MIIFPLSPYNYGNAMYITNDRSDLILDLISEQHKSSLKITDLGCNDGATLCGLKKSGYFGREAEFHGVDYSDVAAGHDEIAFHQADLNGSLSGISSLLESSELILLLDVLEHLQSPEQFLEALSEILNQKSKIIITVPNASSVRLLLAWLKGDFPREDIGFFDRTHRSWFSKKALTKIVSSKFSILDQGYIYSKNKTIKMIQKINSVRLTSQIYICISIK